MDSTNIRNFSLRRLDQKNVVPLFLGSPVGIIETPPGQGEGACPRCALRERRFPKAFSILALRCWSRQFPGEGHRRLQQLREGCAASWGGVRHGIDTVRNLQLRKLPLAPSEHHEQDAGFHKGCPDHAQRATKEQQNNNLLHMGSPNQTKGNVL